MNISKLVKPLPRRLDSLLNYSGPPVQSFDNNIVATGLVSPAADVAVEWLVELDNYRPLSRGRHSVARHSILQVQPGGVTVME